LIEVAKPAELYLASLIALLDQIDLRDSSFEGLGRKLGERFVECEVLKRLICGLKDANRLLIQKLPDFIQFLLDFFGLHREASGRRNNKNPAGGGRPV
jgi:hypothetical protein